MRTITGPSREKVILYAGVLIFILFIRNLLFAEDPFDEEASLKLWKSLDPDSRKLIYQIRKLTLSDHVDEDELADIDEEVEFLTQDGPLIRGTQSNLKHFFGLKDLATDDVGYSVSTSAPKRRGTIVIGNFRSGANHISQMLNQRDDVFFLFEPLAPFGASCTKELDVKNHVLFRLGRCRFPNMEEIFSKKANGKKEQSWTATTCMQHHICFRHRSKKLLEAPFCPHDYSTEKVKQAEILNHCGGVSLSLAQNVCEDSTQIGAKIIRICRLSDLNHLTHDKDVDWRFVWVVRDPRAIAASQEHAKGDEETDTCNHMAANINYLISPMARSLRKKLLIVRYEDVVSDGESMLSRVNQFLDLDDDEEVFEWFEDNTKEDHLVSWQNTLSKSQVSDVQQKCESVMQIFGYRAVQTEPKRVYKFKELVEHWPDGMPPWVSQIAQGYVIHNK